MRPISSEQRRRSGYIDSEEARSSFSSRVGVLPTETQQWILPWSSWVSCLACWRRRMLFPLRSVSRDFQAPPPFFFFTPAMLSDPKISWNAPFYYRIHFEGRRRTLFPLRSVSRDFQANAPPPLFFLHPCHALGPENVLKCTFSLQNATEVQEGKVRLKRKFSGKVTLTCNYNLIRVVWCT